MSASRILVVDDEESVLSVLAMMLEYGGYEAPVLASSGEQAIRLLHSGEVFDLVLCDLSMPGVDGNAVLNFVRQHCPGVPVIMVTAVDEVTVAVRTLRAGAFDYLVKPFSREPLLTAVHRALDHRRTTLENRHYHSNLESLVSARTRELHNAMMELEQSYDITLEALGGALDLKDAATEGHSRRVTAFTVLLAQRLGLAAAQISAIARGAFLHDIGKMAVPDHILRKPGPLSPEEQTIIRGHCYAGYRIVSRIPFLREAAEVVYSHHERYDGSGYPRGLKGEDIPLGARIFAVADSLDAIVSHRPYRPGRPVEAAREEIARHSGSQFDPAVVEAFLQVSVEAWCIPTSGGPMEACHFVQGGIPLQGAGLEEGAGAQT
jgi:putative nucleotidyltransferase with HDIG domain